MRSRPFLLALIVLALLSALALLVIMLTPGSTLLRGGSEAALALEGGVELAVPPAGFRNFVDPGGRFSLVLPEAFKQDKHAPNQHRFRGPETDDHPSWILVTVIPRAEAVGLSQLGAFRDRTFREQANLPYTKFKTEEGELASRPATNRSFLLGAYDGWEVVVDGGEQDSLALTFLATRPRFEQGEALFAKVLQGFRLRR